MGRGRQKAKHTKVARDLKYFSPDTNYGALANELHSGGAPVAPVAPVSPELDKWSEYLDDSYADSKYIDKDDDEYGSGQESSKSA
ncbi:Protein of unknown function (DUF3073) [Glaciihabitans tibetensis]|uniref:DUF3073 family protein n=1 Tax=Glaciihabitans tibetensis TaxID=1266600 RepID=A0A2T0VDF4_9MICO|nr:DUF3073 domain-containing protein [Glaciihabitans tibetensis]PRY68155.1 Protein of unknown function (DUF3073) [Glaciihabitans tibetensis]